LYMPHCERELYSNALSANWNPEQLECLIIVGNRFAAYVERLTTRLLKGSAPFVPHIVPYLECHPFPDNFDNPTIFNDTCVHLFPKTRVCAIEDGFWRRTWKESEQAMARMEQQTDDAELAQM